MRASRSRFEAQQASFEVARDATSRLFRRRSVHPTSHTVRFASTTCRHTRFSARNRCSTRLPPTDAACSGTRCASARAT
eukprot:427225-Prymnesium_polylepis.1